MKELSNFHKLLYVGVDVSPFSKTVNFYTSKRSSYLHASSLCRSIGYRGPTETIQKDRIKVTASAACPHCFDRVFSNEPSWSEGVESLGFCITSENARFLKTIFNENSSKNTPQEMALRLSELEDVQRRIKGYTLKYDEAKFACDKLLRRIDDRIRAIRSALKTPELKLNAERAAISIDALLDANARPVAPAELFDLVGLLSNYSIHKDLLPGVASAVENYVSTGDADSSFVWIRNHLTHTSINTLSQFSSLKVADLAAEDAVNVPEALKKAWARRRGLLVEDFFQTFKSRLIPDAESKQLALGHFQLSKTSLTDEFFGKSLSNIVETFVVSKSESNFLILAPVYVHRAIQKAALHDMRYSLICSVDVKDAPFALFDMAATFYNFGKNSSQKPQAALKMAYEAAVAIEE